MLRTSGKLIGLTVACLVLGSTNTCHALTNPPAASGSVTISAAIAPVRYILVDDHYRITKILSNSQADVTPLVYKNNFNTRPIALRPGIYSQYAGIMASINTRDTGVIYRLKDPEGAKPTAIFRQLRLFGYQSTPFQEPAI